LVPNVTYVKFLSSKLLRWWHQDRRMFDAVFHVGLVAHLVMGIVCALLLGGVAPWLLPLVFGERYAVSSPLIMILALGIPVRFVQHAYGSLLFSKDHIRRKLAYMSSAGVASVGLNIALIPSLGIRGAALGAVLTELMLLLVYMWGVAKHVEGIQVRDSFRIETLRSAFGYVRGQRS
jgi:O-antigen/teichoic acid export membrane protein